MKYVSAALSALLVFGLASIATTASAGGDYGRNDCYRCPPPKNYDSQEVVKTTKDVDSTISSRQHIGEAAHHHTALKRQADQV